MINEKTLPLANEVLAMIAPGYHFEFRVASGRRRTWRNRLLYLVDDPNSRTCQARLSADGQCLLTPWSYGLGNTQKVSIGQLIRWIRGESRYPLRWWRAKWSAAVADRLAALGYDDPAQTCCVLCKRDTVQADWWSDPPGTPHRRVGPCCTYGHCEEP